MEVLHCGNRNFRPFGLLWPRPWPDVLHIQTRPIDRGDMSHVQIWTSYVKAFVVVWQIYRQTYRRPKLYTTPLRGWSKIDGQTGMTYCMRAGNTTLIMTGSVLLHLVHTYSACFPSIRLPFPVSADCVGRVPDIREVSLGKRQLIDHHELSLLPVEGEARAVRTGGPTGQDICAVTANMILPGPRPIDCTWLRCSYCPRAVTIRDYACFPCKKDHICNVGTSTNFTDENKLQRTQIIARIITVKQKQRTETKT